MLEVNVLYNKTTTRFATDADGHNLYIHEKGQYRHISFDRGYDNKHAMREHIRFVLGVQPGEKITFNWSSEAIWPGKACWVSFLC